MNARSDGGNLRATLTRHASEFTGGFIVAVAATLVLCIAFALSAAVQSPTSPNGEHFLSNVVTLPGLDQAERFAWSLHALFVVLSAIGLGQFIWGNGVRPNSLVPNHPSIYYTLSLPVSRTRLVLTRYLFAAGGAAFLVALMLGLNAATLWLFGHAVPLREMSVVSLMGFLFLCVATAAYGLLGVIHDSWAAGLLVVGLVGIMAFAWTPVYRLIAGGPFGGAGGAALLATTAALLAATVYLAKRRDF